MNNDVVKLENKIKVEHNDLQSLIKRIQDT